MLAKPNILLLIRPFFLSHLLICSALFALRFPWRPIPIHVPSMSPQTQEMPTYPVWHHWWAPSYQPAAVSSKCQGIPNRHGRCSEDCQEAGQFLQCHHLLQQTYSAVWTSPPQGNLCQSWILEILKFWGILNCQINVLFEHTFTFMQSTSLKTRL